MILTFIGSPWRKCSCQSHSCPLQHGPVSYRKNCNQEDNIIAWRHSCGKIEQTLKSSQNSKTRHTDMLTYFCMSTISELGCLSKHTSHRKRSKYNGFSSDRIQQSQFTNIVMFPSHILTQKFMPSNMARVKFNPLTSHLTTNSTEDQTSRHGRSEFEGHSYTSIHSSLEAK